MHLVPASEERHAFSKHVCMWRNQPYNANADGICCKALLDFERSRQILLRDAPGDVCC